MNKILMGKNNSKKSTKDYSCETTSSTVLLTLNIMRRRTIAEVYIDTPLGRLIDGEYNDVKNRDCS
jgi:hypothetical protein